MITTSIRSSSLNDLDLCQLKYYLGYILGYRFIANRAANTGSIVHKSCELLALRKFAEQNGHNKFYEKESDREFNCVEMVPDLAADIAFNLYKNEYGFGDSDFKIVREHLQNVIEYRGGHFSPLKRTIIRPEFFFDTEFEDDWANYDFQIGEKKLEGKLKARGTIDLITEVNKDIIEVIDYKTGKTDNDWNSGQKKDFKKLKKDIQLGLYFYILSKLYPEKDIIMTLFFTNSKIIGPRSVYFDKTDLPEIANRLRNYFDRIKKIERPRRIVPNFKCRFCPFSKELWKNSQETYCDFFHNEIRKKGLDKVTEQYIDLSKINDYEGGGKKLKGD